jgi:hypothetical protein
MVTDNQVRMLMKLIQTEKTYEIAAAKTGMDEKTVRKYRRVGKFPSEVKKRLYLFVKMWGREMDTILFLKREKWVHCTILKHLILLTK